MPADRYSAGYADFPGAGLVIAGGIVDDDVYDSSVIIAVS